MTDRARILLVAIAGPAVMIAFAWIAVTQFGPGRGRPPEEPEFVPARLPRFESVAWINRGTFAPESLEGHPTVVALWSDTEPGSLEILPLVQTWWQAYRRYGVRVIGVHSPEFSFAADSTVPMRAASRLGVTFPIALDPHYGIRNRFGDAMPWPGLAVADTAGRIVLQVPLSEAGRVDETIRLLLSRLHPEMGFPTEPDSPGRAPVLRSAVVVSLGAGRVPSGPLAGARPGQAQTYTAQFRFQEEGAPMVPYPVGRWVPGAEGLAAAEGGAANFVAVRSSGGRVRVVMGPPASGAARVWVLANETWLGADASGDDIQLDSRGASYLMVREPRIYEIATGGGPKVFRFSPESAGVVFYALVFDPPRPR